MVFSIPGHYHVCGELLLMLWIARHDDVIAPHLLADVHYCGQHVRLVALRPSPQRERSRRLVPRLNRVKFACMRCCVVGSTRRVRSEGSVPSSTLACAPPPPTPPLARCTPLLYCSAMPWRVSHRAIDRLRNFSRQRTPFVHTTDT